MYIWEKNTETKGVFHVDEKLKVSPAVARAILRVLLDNIEQREHEEETEEGAEKQ